MAPKSRTKKSGPSEKPSEKASKKKEKPKKIAAKNGSCPPKPPPDILDPPAMENLELIAHNAPEALVYRGFNWPNRKKKKK